MTTVATRPTDILEAEHRVIERVLDCLERIAEQAAQGKLDVADARDAIEFFRGFADQCHHGKEETHLFPAMESRGFSPNVGPTAVMRAEHVQGRAYIKAMAEAIDAAEAGDAGATARFCEQAAGYLALLREHIQKEDHCLFPMANQALGPQDQRALLERFAHVEQHEMGAGAHERLEAIAERLGRKYGVPARAGAPRPGGGCCGHGH